MKTNLAALRSPAHAAPYPKVAPQRPRQTATRALLTALLSLASAALHAQADLSGFWYDGDLIYTATPTEGGTVLMHAMAEGEELQFTLLPTQGQPDTYTLANGPDGALNPHGKTATARRITAEQCELLCIYDSKQRITTAMTRETEWDAQKISVSRYLELLTGYYEPLHGETDIYLEFQDQQLTVNLQPTPVRIETFNGLLTPYISIQPTTEQAKPIEGTWEIELTPEGITLTHAPFDDEARWWKRTDTVLPFRSTDHSRAIFAFACSNILTKRQLCTMNPAMLRLLRNGILAQSGWHFEAEDLQQYFDKQLWYEAAPDNDRITLSPIQQINIQLIQQQEATLPREN